MTIATYSAKANKTGRHVRLFKCSVPSSSCALSASAGLFAHLGYFREEFRCAPPLVVISISALSGIVLAQAMS